MVGRLTEMKGAVYWISALLRTCDAARACINQNFQHNVCTHDNPKGNGAPWQGSNGECAHCGMQGVQVGCQVHVQAQEREQALQPRQARRIA